jgi:hypothetical protein
MTAMSGDKPDLGAISGPLTPPSEVPDEPTKRGMKKAKADASKPTLSQRLDAAVDLHITNVGGERDGLKEDNGRLRAELVAEGHAQRRELGRGLKDMHSVVSLDASGTRPESSKRAVRPYPGERLSLRCLSPARVARSSGTAMPVFQPLTMGCMAVASLAQTGRLLR